MKKHFLAIFFVVISFNSLLAQDYWLIRFGNYIISSYIRKSSFTKEVREELRLMKNKDEAKLLLINVEEKLPLIDAIAYYDDVETNDDKGVQKEIKNIQEFNPKLKMTIGLWKHCSNLHTLDLQGNELSIKDRALLTFARSMVKYEAEWKEWHTRKFISDDSKEASKNKAGTRKFFETRLGENGEYTVRNDYNSPYYNHCAITDNNNDNSLLKTINLLENEAYHNELQFMQTQLHKIELYWEIREKLDDQGKEEKAEKDYNNTHLVLENEIKSFKKPENRSAFLKSFALRSAIKQSDIILLQEMRDAYETNNSENFC